MQKDTASSFSNHLDFPYRTTFDTGGQEESQSDPTLLFLHDSDLPYATPSDTTGLAQLRNSMTLSSNLSCYGPHAGSEVYSTSRNGLLDSFASM